MAVPRTVMWTYTWDLVDEGLDAPLAAIMETARTESISLAVAYHISTYFLPHNPRRQLYFGEDGRVFFQPETERYAGTALRPKVSEIVDGPDFLPRIVGRIRERGLGFTAWTVYNYNHHLARAFPQCAKVDALGNPYLTQLCPANPDVRAYHLALTGDVVANYRPDYVFVESPGYHAYNYGWSNPKVQTKVAPRSAFLLSLCFCAHCVAGAERAGLGGGRLRERVADWLRRELPELPPADAPPADEAWQRSLFDGELARFLEVRARLALEAYEAIAAECRRHNVGVFGFVPLSGSEEGPPTKVHTLLDRGLCGTPSLDASTEPVAASRRALRPDAELIAHTHPGGCASEDEYVRRVLATRDAGADGFGAYNYGLIRPAHLRWVGAAVEAWQR